MNEAFILFIIFIPSLISFSLMYIFPLFSPTAFSSFLFTKQNISNLNSSLIEKIHSTEISPKLSTHEYIISISAILFFMLIYLILDKLGKKLEMNKKFREDISTRFLIDLFMIYILFSSYFAMVFVIYNFVLVPMIKQGSVFEFLNQIFKPIPNDALIIIELILITPSLIALGLLYYILKKNYDD
jgi:glucan phosphoethanolaminetransferase (alkaline phosphatase superfamily)